MLRSVRFWSVPAVHSVSSELSHSIQDLLLPCFFLYSYFILLCSHSWKSNSGYLQGSRIRSVQKTPSIFQIRVYRTWKILVFPKVSESHISISQDSQIPILVWIPILASLQQCDLWRGEAKAFKTFLTPSPTSLNCTAEAFFGGGVFFSK